jgi:SpoU rRNA methylase family enzyme
MSDLQELQDASQALRARKRFLRLATEKREKLLEPSSPEPQEVCEAELVVAKAKLGVAEAELDEAKVKEDTTERQPEIAKAEMGVAKAEVGVAKAEWDVAIAAYNAEAKIPNTSTERLRSLQDQIDARKETYKRLEGQLFIR